MRGKHSNTSDHVPGLKETTKDERRELCEAELFRCHQQLTADARMRLASREVASRIIGVAPPMIGEWLGESFRIMATNRYLLLLSTTAYRFRRCRRRSPLAALLLYSSSWRAGGARAGC